MRVPGLRGAVRSLVVKGWHLQSLQKANQMPMDMVKATWRLGRAGSTGRGRMVVAAIRGGFQEIWPSRLGSVGYMGVSSLRPTWHSAANWCAVKSE